MIDVLILIVIIIVPNMVVNVMKHLFHANNCWLDFSVATSAHRDFNAEQLLCSLFGIFPRYLAQVFAQRWNSVNIFRCYKKATVFSQVKK